MRLRIIKVIDHGDFYVSMDDGTVFKFPQMPQGIPDRHIITDPWFNRRQLCQNEQEAS